jgi:hypothetical protein
MREGQTSTRNQAWRDPANRDGQTRTKPGEDRVEPHAAASDLTADRTVAASGGPVDLSDPAVTPPAKTGQPADRRQSGHALNRTQKDIGRTMMLVCGVILVAALVLAALFFRNWIVLGLGLLVIIPFMVMVMAPVWLASSTKVAQDHAVRQQRNGDQMPPGNDRDS